MKLINVATKKGGVGKTTFVTTLATFLANQNKKILLLDFDPQSNLTLNFDDGNLDKNEKKSISKVLSNIELIQIDNFIQPTKFKNIDIIIGGESLKDIPIKLMIDYKTEKELMKISTLFYLQNKAVLDQYDYLIIDNAPTILNFSESFLLISDAVISPITDDLSSFKGFLDLKNTIAKVASETNINFDFKNLHCVLNDVKGPVRKELLEKFIKENDLVDNVLTNYIRHSDTMKDYSFTLDNIWNNKFAWNMKSQYQAIFQELDLN